MAWIGRKKLALIPVYRTPIDRLPGDWPGDILRRMFFDPDSTKGAFQGADRSLRAFIHAASSGVADLDAVVMPRIEVDPPNGDVPVDSLEPQLGADLRSQGFDAAALVMLGGVGSGTAQVGGYWARFVMMEDVGTWAMEFMHCLTGFYDLYKIPGFTDPTDADLGKFDEMSASAGTHPTAYTKAAIGWLDETAIAQHTGRANIYVLHAVGLVQPPPTGRSTAVRIGRRVHYLMVEARLKVDQFEAKIPSEGVIVYEVQTSSPLGQPQNNIVPVRLLTPTALLPNQSFLTDSNVSISVTGAIPGGFTVAVDDRSQPFESGELLFYRDVTRNGTGDVDNPAVIGLGGWQQMKFVFAGDPGVIYAVNAAGQLLFYRDTTRNGTGDVDSPSIIGQGGWQEMRALFYGGDGIIYAVNQQGQLLFYRDTARDGTGDVDTPSVIGIGGWQTMKFVFAGDPGIIYAVNEQGQLLFYRDTTRDGTGDVDTPSIIGQGGWQEMRQLFYGGDGILYAVNQQGQLLFYRDTTRNGTGDVDTPSVIGEGGWQQMQTLFSGGDGIIYAVVQ